MAHVTMPPGCTGLDMADGTRYSGKPGDVVDVRDDHARAINKSWYGTAGVMRGDQTYAIGTRKTRVCIECIPTRHWQAWTESCPRCGASTLIEEAS